MALVSGRKIGRTTPRSPWNGDAGSGAPRFLPVWHTLSLVPQVVRTGSRSEKSAEPPKLGVPAFASFELQKGLIFCEAPGTPCRFPMPRPAGLRTLTNASDVPERSLRRQACVMPAAQVPSPLTQSDEKKFFHCRMSVLRT